MIMRIEKTPYHIISFYKFIHIPYEKLLNIKKSLQDLTETSQIKGLILIGKEGLNATVAGEKVAIAKIQSFLDQQFEKSLSYKDSYSLFQPFKRMKVQIRKEIIKMKPISPEMVENATYFSPEAWDQALLKGDGLFLDVRNWYETQIGTFSLAKVLNIQTFAEFGKKFKQMDIPKDQPIYTFCTGGIRCEKACLEMQEMGYTKTYQLKGGILNYLHAHLGQKDNQWQGECFVFDHRVAVDVSLQPSKTYALCPHCGQPARNAMHCVKCDKPTKLCDMCLEKALPHTCSKNCTYHYTKL